MRSITTTMPARIPRPDSHTPEAVVQGVAGGCNRSRRCERGEAAVPCVASCFYDECRSAIRPPAPQDAGGASRSHNPQAHLIPLSRSTKATRIRVIGIPMTIPLRHHVRRRRFSLSTNGKRKRVITARCATRPACTLRIHSINSTTPGGHITQ